MSTQQIPVWYADRERAHSEWKLLVLDDRGILKSTPDGLWFEGQKQRFLLIDIQQVTLERQLFPWKMWLAADAALMALVALQLMLSTAMGEPPGAAVALARFGGFLVVLAALNVFGVLIGRRSLWVRVDHRDQTGQRRVSFFAVSTLRGWGGLVGDSNRRLHDALSFLRHAPAPYCGAADSPALASDGAIQQHFAAAAAMTATSMWETMSAPLAILSLLLGIASLLLVCFLFPLFVTSPAAIVIGHLARYAARQSRTRNSAAGLAMAGLVLGYVTLIVPIGFVALLFVGPINLQIPLR